MKTLIKKVTVAVTLLGILATAGSALAATQYPGGVWTYGPDRGGAFSNYYHGSKWHSSTVVSRWNSNSSYSGKIAPNQTARARIRTSWGEKVAFYYNYW